jgi:hypothetical protein
LRRTEQRRQLTALRDGSVRCSLLYVAPAGDEKNIPIIETILLHLPRLRSLVVRGNSRHTLRTDIELVSNSLESLIIHNDKEAWLRRRLQLPKAANSAALHLVRAPIRVVRTENRYPCDGSNDESCGPEAHMVQAYIRCC